MIEADAKIVDNDTMLGAVKLAMDTAKEFNNQLSEFASGNGHVSVKVVVLAVGRARRSAFKHGFQKRQFLELHCLG